MKPEIEIIDWLNSQSYIHEVNVSKRYIEGKFMEDEDTISKETISSINAMMDNDYYFFFYEGKISICITRK